MNLDKFEEGGTRLEELASPEARAKAPYAAGSDVPLIDQWLFARLAITIETVNSALDNYRFHEAAQNVYQFFWGDFCDWYIEWVKPELLSADRERATVAWKNLFAAFDAALRLLHPFMPFITEELWHQLPQQPGAKSIALSQFPEVRAEWKNPAALERFALIQEMIGAVRIIRSEMKLDPRKKVGAEFSVADSAIRTFIETNRDGILRLALVSDLKLSAERQSQPGGAVRSTAQFDVRIEYEETVDVGAELVRVRKEIERIAKDIASKERQLGDETFRSRAPEKIIRGMEATLEERRVELKKLAERLSQLEKAA
jgi:valyl-tRNA synthetase